MLEVANVPSDKSDAQKRFDISLRGNARCFELKAETEAEMKNWVLLLREGVKTAGTASGTSGTKFWKNTIQRKQIMSGAGGSSRNLEIHTRARGISERKEVKRQMERLMAPSAAPHIGRRRSITETFLVQSKPGLDAIISSGRVRHSDLVGKQRKETAALLSLRRQADSPGVAIRPQSPDVEKQISGMSTLSREAEREINKFRDAMYSTGTLSPRSGGSGGSTTAPHSARSRGSARPTPRQPTSTTTSPAIHARTGNGSHDKRVRTGSDLFGPLGATPEPSIGSLLASPSNMPRISGNFAPLRSEPWNLAAISRGQGAPRRDEEEDLSMSLDFTKVDIRSRRALS